MHFYANAPYSVHASCADSPVLSCSGQKTHITSTQEKSDVVHHKKSASAQQCCWPWWTHTHTQSANGTWNEWMQWSRLTMLRREVLSRGRQSIDRLSFTCFSDMLQRSIAAAAAAAYCSLTLLSIDLILSRRRYIFKLLLSCYRGAHSLTFQ